MKNLIVLALGAASLVLSPDSNHRDAPAAPYVRTGMESSSFATNVSPLHGPRALAGTPRYALDTTALAWHNQPVPGGGTLSPGAFFNPATSAGAGRVAFYSQVNGSARNQGIFTADASGLHPIVMGCGGGGGSGNPGNGCGDPSPIGGTFSGFFGGTVFAPAANKLGDLLFVADVNGGSAPRALFLYRSSLQSIVKIAAVGDPSPAGGTIGFVGPGSINDSDVVVFLAAGSSINDHEILRWQHGVLTKVAHVGDPAPSGGSFVAVGGESFGFVDGTSIPSGPVPDVNSLGEISFRGIVTGGAIRGIVVDNGGTEQWYVQAGQATPAGGTYFDMQAASINDAGEIAFFADYHPTPSTSSSGWFAGSPGNWRTGLTFFDPVGVGQCFGLAFSRNPMSPLADNGDLLLWTDVKMPDNSMIEALVVRRSNGQLVTRAQHGDPTPLGGTVGTMDSWPSLDDEGEGTLNAATPGASGGILSAHMLFH